MPARNGNDVDGFDCSGCATNGQRYDSIAAMWQSELLHTSTDPEEEKQTDVTPETPTADDTDDQGWYQKSERYWQQQTASVQGMLGGLGELDARDVTASRKFLDLLYRDNPPPPSAIAIDVGAGIGRVTKHLLLPLFRTVDMLEQNVNYLEESRSFILSQAVAGKVDKRIACGMQNFWAKGILGADNVPSGSLEQRYYLVWIQWCIIYLTDDDLVSFLHECTKALAPGGLICLKDNVARAGFIVDKEDSSVMRSDKYLKHLFRRARLVIVRETKQVDFPRNIFPVRTYALRPSENDSSQPT